MSGRLIITNKKSYTPWNAKNTERVLRDQRIERERAEKEELKAEEKRNRERILFMKKQKYGKHLNAATETAEEDKHVESLRHVNLFEEEEKNQMQNILGSKEKKVCTGIMPVFLSNSKQADQDDERRNFYQRRNVLSAEVDDNLKNAMDPMRYFQRLKPLQPQQEKKVSLPDVKDASYSLEKSRRRTEKRRHQSRKHDEHDRDKKKMPKESVERSSKHNSSSSNRIEVLRLRQKKRYEIESERERKLRLGTG
jgi:hypothetical protein